MNINQFSDFIKHTDLQIQQIANIHLSNFEKYQTEIRQQFLEFKSGGEELIKEGNILKIGVVGQVKAGKSSFLNSLFFEGDSVLPKASTPMTAGLTVLEYAEENSFEVEYYSKDDWKEFENLNMLYCKVREEVKSDPNMKGVSESMIERAVKEGTTELEQSGYELVSRCGNTARRKIGAEPEVVAFSGHRDLQQVLNSYVGAEGEYTSVVKSLVIHLKDERLKGIRVVDTPGVNDPIVSRENRTRQFLHSCHGVFFLSYASRFFDSTDASFMNTRVGGQGVGTVLLLASKYDDVLQDQGLKYADDLDGADTASRRALEKRFREQSGELDNKNMDIRFDTTSGISYTLANKPSGEWDSIEQHVAQQMKKLFPSAFADAQSAKETYLALANMDVIREDYLEGMFKKNKEQIIQQKVKEYFERNTENLYQVVAEAVDRMEEKRKELNTVGVAQLKKQKENQKRLFESLKSDFSLFIQIFANSLQKEIKLLKENIPYPSCLNVPMITEEVSVRHKGKILFFTTTDTDQYDVKQIETEQLRRNLMTLTADYERKWKDEWRKHYETMKQQLFDAFCEKITEFSKRCEDLSFNDSYYRNLIDGTLSDIDVCKILETQNVLVDFQNQFARLCNDQEYRITNPSYDCSGSEVQGKLNRLSKEKEENMREEIQLRMKYFTDGIVKEANKTVAQVLSQLEKLRKNIDERLVHAGEDYLRQLEDDLKHKVEVEKKITEALNVLIETKKTIEGVKKQ